jgi:hypothetical protein
MALHEGLFGTKCCSSIPPKAASATSSVACPSQGNEGRLPGSYSSLLSDRQFAGGMQCLFVAELPIGEIALSRKSFYEVHGDVSP